MKQEALRSLRKARVELERVALCLEDSAYPWVATTIHEALAVCKPQLEYAAKQLRTDGLWR